jgi:Ser/Thr protein kinase RdoA (MazF antagonist)
VLPWGELTRIGRRRRLAALARHALGAWGLRTARLRLLADDTNAVYLVAAEEGRFVLRVGRRGVIGHPEEQIRSEVCWLAALARESGARAPEPVATPEGDLLTRVKHPGVPEARICVLFRWLPGTLLDRRPTTTNLEAYGALAAALHEHAAGFTPTSGATPLRWDRLFPFDEPVVLFDELPAASRGIYRDAAGLVDEQLRTMPGPARLIHGDLHVWNVLVHQGAAAAIDFEDHMWGWPAQDLGVALYYLYGRPGFPGMEAAIRRGYERVAAWPDRRSVLAFVAGRTLVLANDVLLLAAYGEEEDLDVVAFFDRAERRLRAILTGDSFTA